MAEHKVGLMQCFIQRGREMQVNTVRMWKASDSLCGMFYSSFPIIILSQCFSNFNKGFKVSP